ncbi:MAG: HAD hydrolase-like protein [Candidatus Heimdallarchaeota archaeon]|nr:MAG: HAD hydrolase-like protein [Candidatus Heimdallarchaeota archaeon]
MKVSPLLDLIFDLHGVLADVHAVNKNYQKYLEKILVPVGIQRQKVIEIHEIAFRNWITEIFLLFEQFDEFEKTGSNSEVFMKNYRQIDNKWEEFILNFVGLEHQKSISSLLSTPRVEYEALAHGPHPILFPEVSSALEKLFNFNPHLHMHIASSASSRHVKGAVTLHNLNNFFQRLIGYDTVRAPKKASSGIYFKRMLQFIGTEPNRAIFVGDSLEEATLAIKSGMRFVMVLRNKSSTFKKPRSLDFKVIDNLTDLIPIIRALVD